jgi:hypothetical protein
MNKKGQQVTGGIAKSRGYVPRLTIFAMLNIRSFD